MKKAFPTFWVVVLVVALVWFLSDLGLIAMDVPWFPAALLIFAIGAIINHYSRR